MKGRSQDLKNENLTNLRGFKGVTVGEAKRDSEQIVKGPLISDSEDLNPNLDEKSSSSIDDNSYNKVNYLIKLGKFYNYIQYVNKNFLVQDKSYLTDVLQPAAESQQVVSSVEENVQQKQRSAPKRGRTLDSSFVSKSFVSKLNSQSHSPPPLRGQEISTHLESDFEEKTQLEEKWKKKCKDLGLNSEDARRYLQYVRGNISLLDKRCEQFVKKGNSLNFNDNKVQEDFNNYRKELSYIIGELNLEIEVLKQLKDNNSLSSVTEKSSNQQIRLEEVWSNSKLTKMNNNLCSILQKELDNAISDNQELKKELYRKINDESEKSKEAVDDFCSHFIGKIDQSESREDASKSEIKNRFKMLNNLYKKLDTNEVKSSVSVKDFILSKYKELLSIDEIVNTKRENSIQKELKKLEKIPEQHEDDQSGNLANFDTLFAKAVNKVRAFYNPEVVARDNKQMFEKSFNELFKQLNDLNRSDPVQKKNFGILSSIEKSINNSIDSKDCDTATSNVIKSLNKRLEIDKSNEKANVDLPGNSLIVQTQNVLNTSKTDLLNSTKPDLLNSTVLALGGMSGFLSHSLKMIKDEQLLTQDSAISLITLLKEVQDFTKKTENLKILNLAQANVNIKNNEYAEKALAALSGKPMHTVSCFTIVDDNNNVEQIVFACNFKSEEESDNKQHYEWDKKSCNNIINSLKRDFQGLQQSRFIFIKPIVPALNNDENMSAVHAEMQLYSYIKEKFHTELEKGSLQIGVSKSACINCHEKLTNKIEHRKDFYTNSTTDNWVKPKFIKTKIAYDYDARSNNSELQAPSTLLTDCKVKSEPRSQSSRG